MLDTVSTIATGRGLQWPERMHSELGSNFPINSVTISVRIAITPSARRHAITDDEIRSAVEYPQLRLPVVSRSFPDADPYLYVAQIGDSTPYLEVVAEQITTDTIEVFHAMLLRQSTIASTGIVDYIDPAHVARTQRR